MVAAEGTSTDDGYAEWIGHKLFEVDRGFDGFAAAGVEFEELSDGFFVFGR